MYDALAEARSVLEERARTLRAELTMVESAISVLSGAALQRVRRKPGPSTAPKEKPPERRGASRTRTRQTREQREREVINYARANPAASNRSIAKALGITPPYVTRLMKSLGDSGTVVRKSGRLVVIEGN